MLRLARVHSMKTMRAGETLVVPHIAIVKFVLCRLRMAASVVRGCRCELQVVSCECCKVNQQVKRARIDHVEEATQPAHLDSQYSLLAMCDGSLTASFRPQKSVC